MALIITILIFIIVVLFLLNFIFFGPIISTSDNIKYLDGFSDILQPDVLFYQLIRYNEICTLNYKTPCLVYRDANGEHILGDDLSYNSLAPTDDIIAGFHGFNSDSSEMKDLLKNYLNNKYSYYVATNNKSTISAIGFDMPGADTDVPGSYVNVTAQTYMKYVHDVMIRLDNIYKDITIVASSTGCSYIIWFLYKFPDLTKKISKIIFFSPNIEFHPFEKFVSEMALYPFGKKMVNLLDQRLFSDNGKQYFDSYQFIHLIGIMGLLRKIKFKLNVDIPINILYTSKDKVVSPKATVEFYEKYKGKKKLIDTKSLNHNIIKDVLEQDIEYDNE